MELSEQQLEWLKQNTKSHDIHLQEQLADAEYQRQWLETTLSEFLSNGDIDEFVTALTYVVKARGRGEISRLSKDLNIDRSNLSEIVNGKKIPHLNTALKLLDGLGFSCRVKVERKSA